MGERYKGDYEILDTSILDGKNDIGKRIKETGIRKQRDDEEARLKGKGSRGKETGKNGAMQKAQGIRI